VAGLLQTRLFAARAVIWKTFVLEAEASDGPGGGWVSWAEAASAKLNDAKRARTGMREFMGVLICFIGMAFGGDRLAKRWA
jgi:hypothetical protein